jgi:hypothetical protein
VIGLLAVIFVFLLIGVWGWPLVAGVLGLSSVADKPAALQHIRQLMITYDIAPAEVEKAFDAPASINSVARQRSKSDVAKALFIYLGVIFVVAGIGTYVGMFWDSMGSLMRIFVTLGVGYILLIVLVWALHENEMQRLALPLTIAGVFFLLGGWLVFIDEMFPNSDNWRAATLFVFGMMTLHFGVLFSKYQHLKFAFTALFFVYGFMHVGLDMLGISTANIAIILGASLFLVGAALEKSPQRVLAGAALLIGTCWLNSGLFDLIAMSTAANWASIITGVCVMSTAYGLHVADRYPRLIGLGYFVGSIMFYSGLFDLVNNTSIELIYLAVTASILYGSVVLQSRALLLSTVLAMLSYIGYFSAKYFSDFLGWPVTLVLMGIAFLGIGTIAIKLKKKI